MPSAIARTRSFDTLMEAVNDVVGIRCTLSVCVSEGRRNEIIFSDTRISVVMIFLTFSFPPYSTYKWGNGQLSHIPLHSRS